MTRGDLFIVSSPSGAGKTTLIRRVLEDPRIGGTLHFSVSHTTRPPRAGETDGVEYHFVRRGGLPRARGRGRVPGVGDRPREPLRHVARGGRAPPRERASTSSSTSTSRGPARCAPRVPEAVKVIVFPPSREVLEARLKARASDAPEVVAPAPRRRPPRRWTSSGEYDYAIINDGLEPAVDELRSIIVARRAGRGRRRERLEAILKTFAP